MKIFILLLPIIATAIQLTQSASLRRRPKVYNALITTDQNLTPSRAFPIIQPHLQETYAYPSYSYRSYAPLGLYNNGFPYRSPPASYNGFHSYPRLNPGIVEARNFYPRDDIHTTLPPIPSDFSLTPSLVPINSFAFGNLAPYPYHSYPTYAYDQFGGFGGYLPPYSFYPPGFDALDNSKNDGGKDNKDEKPDGSSSADGGKGESDGKSSTSNSSGSSKSNSDGSSGGSSNSGGNGGSNGSGGNSGSNGSGGNSGSSGSGGNSGSSSSSSSSTGTSSKSSRLRNFDKPEFLQQQSLSGNIKNFPNKDPTIPDIDPSPPVRVKPINK